MYSAELLHFVYTCVFIEDLSVKKSNCVKPKGGRNEIVLTHKLTGRIQKFTGFVFVLFFPKRSQVFSYDCLSFRLSPRLIIATGALKLIDDSPYVMI